MNNKPTFDTLVKSWKELNQDKQRKEYNFIKVDRNFIQNNDYTTTQKGLYLLLLCLSKPITTNERYVSVNVNDLITYVTPSKDTRTKRNTKELLLTTLMELQEHEIISYDGMINDNINVYINTDVTPFTKLYEIDALQALDKMTTSRADTTLTLYAAYAFVYVSVGNGKVKNKGIYIHGLTYMSNCLDVEYRTLQRYLDELVEKQFIVKKDYMESKNKKKVVISLYNNIDIERLGQYIAKKTTKSKKDNKQLDQEQQQENNASDDANISDDKEKETTDTTILDNETSTDNDKDNRQDNANTSDDKEQEKRLKIIKDYTNLDDESVKELYNAWKEHSTELLDWNLYEFEDAYIWFKKHNNTSTQHKINWLKKTFDDRIESTKQVLKDRERKLKRQKELTEIETKKRLAEKERLKDIKKLPYQRKSKTGGKAKWQLLEDEEEPNTNSDTSKEKQNQQQETDKKEPSTLTPKQENVTLDDNTSDYSYYEMKNRSLINKYLPQEQKEKRVNAILDRMSKQEHITHDDNDKDNRQEIMQDEQVEIIKQREQELMYQQQEQEFANGVELTPEEQDEALDELLGL
ncbi:hypothetical protein [Ligilactobacillus salivarius]|nr:hypothetical protein [Ligilactobacillus salivarius]